jgi:hypothetical protein
MNHKMMR